MANNTMTVREKKIQSFKQVLNDTSIRNRIKTSLGENAGNFLASMLDLYEGETALQNCDPQKVAMECLKAASLNLPLVKGLGFAYVVPYGSTPTFIVGYRGMIQLAQRSGQYRFLNADAVYEGEAVRVNRLTGQMEISGTKASDRAIGYFAYFQLTNGFEKYLYMTVEEVNAYAKKYSKAYNSGPWKTEFDAMAKKTVLRRILKYGPMSTDMQNVETYEVQAARAQAQAEIDAYANGRVIDTSPELPPSAASALPPAPQGISVDMDTGEVIEAAAPPQDAADAQQMMGGPDF